MPKSTSLKPLDSVAVRHPDGGYSDTGQVLEPTINGFWRFCSEDDPYAEYEVHESRLVKTTNRAR